MDARITHDKGGICVEVFHHGWSLTLRMVDGSLRKTASTGGFIPKPDFEQMLRYGRDEHTVHHCDGCPPQEDPHPTHFRKETGTISNPRHWADRDDD